MVTQPTLSHLWVRCRGPDPGGVWEHSQVKCHGQGLNERPLEGRVKVPARTRGPIPQPGKWVQYPKVRKTGPLPLCLSLDT